MQHVPDIAEREGNRTYIVTAKRMISGLVSKHLKGECLGVAAGYRPGRRLQPKFF
jgi:hypothetical protein